MIGKSLLYDAEEGWLRIERKVGGEWQFKEAKDQTVNLKDDLIISYDILLIISTQAEAIFLNLSANEILL